MKYECPEPLNLRFCPYLTLFINLSLSITPAREAAQHAAARGEVSRAFDEGEEGFVVSPGIADEDDVFLQVHADRGEDDDATSRNGEDSVASSATNALAVDDEGKRLELRTRWKGRGGAGRARQAARGGDDIPVIWMGSRGELG
ncbi:hypothetical protein C8J57DRAFT_1241346 [Mycena rebaudengoi]|nr:hypothetical protein C8J57DRAFT_1241346 [Mycena rebaudengoi]